MSNNCDSDSTVQIHVIMVCAKRLLQFYNTNKCIVKLTSCVSVALNLFNTKRQPSGNETTTLRVLQRSQPSSQSILVHLFISNINFKGVYLQYAPLVSLDILAISLLFSFHLY